MEKEYILIKMEIRLELFSQNGEVTEKLPILKEEEIKLLTTKTRRVRL